MREGAPQGTFTRRLAPSHLPKADIRGHLKQAGLADGISGLWDMERLEDMVAVMEREMARQK